MIRRPASTAARRRNPADAKAVSAIILAQLGGAGRVSAMLGRPTMGYGTSPEGPYLSIKFASPHRGPNYCKITLTPADTYTVEFGKVVKYDVKPVGTYHDVYADALKPLFERVTGLYLSLGTMGRSNPAKRGKARRNPGILHEKGTIWAKSCKRRPAKRNPSGLTVDLIRRLPSLVIIGAPSLAAEVRAILGDELPRQRVVVEGAKGHTAQQVAAAIRKARGPLMNPRRNNPVVGRYLTASGLVGAEIFESPYGLRWSGKWGAGSGHSHADMLAEVQNWLRNKRGVRVDVAFPGTAKRNPPTGDDDVTRPYPWQKKEDEYAAWQMGPQQLREAHDEAMRNRDQADATAKPSMSAVARAETALKAAEKVHSAALKAANRDYAIYGWHADDVSTVMRERKRRIDAANHTAASVIATLSNPGRRNPKFSKGR